MERRWPGIIFSQQVGAELLADKYKLTRDELDRFALESHRRAAAAIKGGHFKREIVAVQGRDHEDRAVRFDVDEGVRADTSLEQLAKLAVLDPKRPNSKVTAGTSSQVSNNKRRQLLLTRACARRFRMAPLPC